MRALRFAFAGEIESTNLGLVESEKRPTSFVGVSGSSIKVPLQVLTHSKVAGCGGHPATVFCESEMVSCR